MVSFLKDVFEHAWSHFLAPDGNVYEIMSGPEPAA